jgi:hypothetical protein
MAPGEGIGQSGPVNADYLGDNSLHGAIGPHASGLGLQGDPAIDLQIGGRLSTLPLSDLTYEHASLLLDDALPF